VTTDVGFLELFLQRMSGTDFGFLLFLGGVLLGAVGAFAIITWALVQEARGERDGDPYPSRASSRRGDE